MLLQADVDVHTVDPQVDVVDARQVAGGEGALLGLPLLGQPGDHRREQAGVRAQELPQSRHEVPAGQAARVQQRQHRADGRGLARPGRQDRRGEPRALPGDRIDTLVTDPRRGDLDRAGRGEHRPR